MKVLDQVAGWYSMMRLHPQRHKGRPLAEEVSGHPTRLQVEGVSRAGDGFRIFERFRRKA